MTASLRGVRVVCFYPWTPFEPTGAWSRFSCLWRFLLEEGAEVTLAFLDQGTNARLKNVSLRFLGDLNLISKIGIFAQKVSSSDAKSELKNYSPTEVSFLLMYEKSVFLSNPKTGPWLDEMIKDQDIVTCDYPMFVPFISDYSKKWKKPLVVTSHDMLFELHGSHPGAKERLKQKELQALKLADALVFCNDTERKVFEGFGLKGVTVLNTGDTLGVTPGKEEESRLHVRTALSIKSAHYTLFVGSLHGPNQEAVIEIKRMAKAMPETAFVVVGSCCAKGADGNFIALGMVTEQDLDTLYRGASLVLVPLLRGTGMSIKVFQAFIYAKAVLATPTGARGFTVTDNEELSLVQSSLEFPAAIRRLLANDNLRRQMGEKARDYAVRLDFRTQFRPYSDIIRRLTNRVDASEPKDVLGLILVDNNLSDRVGHHFNYALSLKERCVVAGLPFAALIKKSSPPDVRSALSAEEAFSVGIHEATSRNPYPPEWGSLQGTYDFLLSSDQFARELEEGLTGRAAYSDVVFIPNATPRQILGVALLLHKSPIYKTLRFILVLRYSIYSILGPISERRMELNKEEAERYAISLEKLELVDQAGSVRLATDSTELAQEYAPFSKRIIEVLPIPHTANEPPTVFPKNVPAKFPNKIRVVFLGDAREEKGFELLPAVVRACVQDDLASRVEFVFQVFVSSHHHRGMVPTIEELVRLKLPNVQLIGTTLSSDAYHALLASADLVLVPYDALTYRARTSGPFVEAICAGKPVVVPKQSWMSAQLGDSLAGESFISGNTQDFVRAVLAALGNLAEYTRAAEALGQRFRDFHNPQNFIKQLMGTR